MDTLGREFLTVDDNGPLGKYKVRNTLDIAGNTTKVTDAKGREMTFHTYDMLKRPLRTRNIDSGTRVSLADAADKPLRTSDLTGFENLSGLTGSLQSFTYDELQRPVDMILTTDSDRTVQKTVYGTNPDLNNIGKPYKILDQSGIQTFTDYDFKGNPLQTLKEFCEDSENTIDWSEATINTLIKSFSNSQIFDALNRPVLQTKPDGSVVKYEFNEAGLLETIQRQTLSGASSPDRVITPFVTNINYNARGQHIDIYYADPQSS